MLHYQRVLLFISVICFVNNPLSSQSKLQGSVVKDKHQPAPGATVLLLNSKDSSLVKGLFSSTDGNYFFEKIAPGNYVVAASFSGYKQAYSPVITVAENESRTIDALTLTEKTNTMEGVTVAARKPLFEQKIDRTVINVANNITAAGSTVLDVLERSPGIVVDRQNNSLSINGKNGVVVMINGRINYMPVTALVQMLAGMPSDNVEKVELITTPPANFDAEGNAGYINIVLKKNMQLGTNGSYSVMAGYSKGLLNDATFNFNHRETKWNLYSNYSFNRIASSQTAIFSHASWNQGTFFENFSQTDRDPVETISDLKIGFDYDVRKDIVAGVLVSLYNRGWDMDAHNFSSVYTNGQLDTIAKVINKEKHPLNSYDVNLNLQKNYKEGKLTFNADYMNYREKNPVSYINSYYNGNGIFLYNEEVKSNKNTPIHVWVGTMDLDQKLSEKINMSAGVKATLSSFTNSVAIDRLLQGGWTADPDLTATYFLNENISAAYSSFDWSLSKRTKMKAGLRFEYTNSNLKTASIKNIVDRHYGKLFPSFFLSHAMKDDNSVSFAYSRRITRPTFWNLAPFVIFMDPNTFFSGNPGLQPSITDNFNTSIVISKKIVSISYSYESKPITDFSPHVDAKTNKETLSAENQDHSQSLSISFSLPFELTKWWTLQLSLNGDYTKMNGLYNGESIILKQESFFGNAIQNFKLPKEFTFSVSGFYTTGGLFGLYKSKPLGTLDFGLQKKFADKKSALRLNYANALNSIKPQFSVNIPEKNLIASGQILFSHPALRLIFTHNFGSDKVKAKRDRSTGAEEEKDRLKM
jgi:outer membrane receptor protein involved in Fe transport